MANIDQETFNSSYKPNVSEDEFKNRFTPEQSGQGTINTVKDVFRGFLMNGPYTGQTSDQMFSGGTVGRIMSAFGQGFKDTWGEDSFYKREIDKEAREKDVGLLTALRNSAMKPAAAAIDAVAKTPFAVMGGVAGATGQAGEELKGAARGLQDSSVNPDFGIDTPWQRVRLDPGSLLGAPLAAAGELLGGVASGGLLEGGPYGHASGLDHIQQISEARSKGIIGEGEAGYFKVKPPSPEDLQARESAAHDAGTWTPKFQEGAFSSIEDHVPTVLELARQMDPDTFNQLDSLADLKENLSNSIQTEITKRKQDIELGVSEDHPRLKRQAADISEMQERLQRADEGLRDLIPDVADAKERAQDLLESQSPEGDAYRNFIQAQAFERAIQAEPLKGRAEEALRLANDLKEANAPKETTTPKPKTKTDTLKSTPIDKQPEVKLDPDGGIPRKKVQGTGDKTPLSTNQRLQLDAVIQGWRREVGDVPQEEILKNEQQLSDALRFYEESPGLAEKVAMGDAPVPDGYNIHPEAVLRVLKKQAEDTGDHELGLRLAETKLAGEHRDIGQRLQLLRGAYDIDLVGIIQDLNKVMSEKAKKTITKVQKEIQAAVDEAMATFKPDIEKFLKAIECE